MASQGSSGRITWATLSWSTGLRPSFGREGARSTCLPPVTATPTSILSIPTLNEHPMTALTQRLKALFGASFCLPKLVGDEFREYLFQFV
jgi:hypothetical protein